MPINIIAPPEDEPVTLDEAKAFARIEDDYEDELIETLISAAREFVENATGRSFIAATYLYTARGFDCDLIRLPRSPLISVESAIYRGRDGAEHELETIDYLVDTTAEPGTIEPIKCWPAMGDYPDAVKVRFVAGYETNDSPAQSTIPARALVAIKALVAHWYDNRGPIAEGGWNEAPFHVTRLISRLRVWA